MKLSKTSITLYLLLVFASGIAVGAFGHRLYTVTTVSAGTPRQPDEWRKQYLAEMQSRLKLSPTQLTTLNSILDETRARFQEVRERTRPQFDAIKQEQVNKIRGILDDRQREEYQQMRREREAREKAGQAPGPGI